MNDCRCYQGGRTSCRVHHAFAGSRGDLIQVDPEKNSDYVMGPSDDVPRPATEEEREMLGLLPRDPFSPFSAPVRQFDTGATRNPDEGELDYEAFLSPLALRAYGEYMHEHRFQADGSLRAGDNWQKGIPQESYVKSLLRHTMDVWLEHRGHESREGMVKGLCGVIFNAHGLLHELTKESGT